LGNGHHFFKALEKTQRELDPDQINLVRAGAFERWYGPLKEQAETDGVIFRDPSLLEEDLDPGLDGEEPFDEGDLPLDELPIEE
jgi:hypothetical protein